ncbi:MAG: leucyl aminopeptidase, partial [Albidovulum sp.]
MSAPLPITFAKLEAEAVTAATGRIALLLNSDGKAGPIGRRIDRLSRGAVARATASAAWDKMKPGEALDIAWPAGLEAEALQLVKLPRRATVAEARKAGAAIGKALGAGGVTVVAEGQVRIANLSLGLVLKAYDFNAHKTTGVKEKGPVTVLTADPDAARSASKTALAVAEGVCFTRDLVNEPANVLTTTDFASRLKAMEKLGLKVEVLDEEAMAKLGMGALLGVGQGSESPSQLVVMQWNGGKKGDAPFALVGKGVVFDTGGISIKPAAGMEEMT